MNYYKAAEDRPFHLSVGAVVLNEKNEVACHYFADTFNFKDIYILMRETVEQGERLEDAVHRGLQEEWGMDAKILGYIGSTRGTIDFVAPLEFEKTTLYFLCTLDNHDITRRHADDPEGQSEILWLPIDELHEKMKNQFERYGHQDLSETVILDNLKLIVNHHE